MTQSGRNGNIKLILIGILAISNFLITFSAKSNRANAQIIPDRTLGNESSVVTPNIEIKGLAGDRIDGGAIRDSNLFHSFQEFNIGDLQRVYFANPEGITNIFSRVTGSNLSEIFGTLGVNGNANLFLINPNGIIFGENASLDLGGSFVATTADAIQFGDRGWFSATEPETPPLLTIKPSALFFNQITPSPIVNRSIAPAGEDLTGFTLFGLRVSNGRSLVLAGGEITIDGGGIQALRGQIELTGVADSAKVALNIEENNLSLSVPEEITRGNISLQNLAFVNVTADDGGSIAIKAGNLEIVDSFIFAGIDSGLGTSDSQAGDIVLEATETITIGGSRIRNWVYSGATGKGGDLQIIANSFTAENSTSLRVDTLGKGDTGRVVVRVNDAVTLTDGSTIFNTVRSGAMGNARGVSIQANSFTLLEGAEIQAGNRGGQGNAGDVTVEVRDRVFFDGLFSDGFSSGIFAGVVAEGIGEAGEIKISANSLTLSDGARLQTKSEGLGDSGNVIINVRDEIFFDGAETNPQPEFEHITGIFTTLETATFQQGGDIHIKTGSLKIVNGAEITADTFGLGDSGNITIQAKDGITLDGKNNRTGISGIFTAVGNSPPPNQAVGKGQGGNIQITTNSLSLTNGGTIAASTLGEGDAGKINITAFDRVSLDGEGTNIGTFVTSEAIGNGNDLEVTTSQLTLSNGARLDASALGDGDAGNIKVNADSLTLTDRASISTETASNTGGDIRLTIQDLLLLRRGSNISATAGIAEGAGNGGNITINTPLLVAFLQENSDITANAFEGNGGNIDIDAQNILGFKLQEDPKLSSITASSELGLDGIININTSEIEPGQELIELPTEIVDVSRLINQNFCLAGQQGEFIITGKGGLSPSPQDTLNTDAGWEDWRIIGNSESNYQQSSPTEAAPKVNNPKPSQIIEAQSWYIAPNGNIVLSAKPVESVSRNSSFSSFNCYLIDELKK